MPDPQSLYDVQLQGRDIRLVRLIPDPDADEASPTECCLSRECLDDLPPYYALSYVWGDPDLTETIRCNGEPLEVTVNLAKALRRLRQGFVPPESSRSKQRVRLTRRGSPVPYVEPAPHYLFWIDAICINQQNVTERSHQVQLMKDVYSRARGVVVWLGDQDPKEEGVAAAIEAVKLVVIHKARDRESVLTTKKLYQKMCDSEIPHAFYSLNTLFASGWYTRLWCVQEAACARETYLLFNRHALNGKDIVSFHTWLRYKCDDQSDDPVSEFSLQSFKNMEEIERRLSAKSKILSPLYLLSLFRSLEAKDPRDNIYGLLGLLEPQHSIFQVDYTKTTTEVYTSAAIQLISHDNELGVLSHVDHHAEFSPISEFPSWVPRWNQHADLSICPNNSMSGFAGRRQTPNVDATQSNKGILFIQGLRCGGVKFVTPKVSQISGTALGKFLQAQKWANMDALATTLTGGHGLYTGNAERWREYFLADFKAYAEQHLGNPKVWHLEGASECNYWVQDASSYENKVKLYAHNRRLFRTDRRWVGLGPACMRKGDRIAVMTGGRTPFVLRPAGNGQYYFMGECYTYDIARGEAYDILGKEGIKERMFELI
ncbi:hypothetical protein OPT61_g2010 [Boeremia exigua]|uniref:Uncharacterized protein n=1 Tax=Boeremia exigua TaxID=749465 RepID=A0ACC2IN32_9PLEO|nr:hypothetical protein OPT61_g2010 [Boeremia exigua]